jgi:hypothetical protein
VYGKEHRNKTVKKENRTTSVSIKSSQYKMQRKKICEQFIQTNILVKQNTNLSNIVSLNALYSFLHHKVLNMRYWIGKKRTIISTKVNRKKQTISKSSSGKTQMTTENFLKTTKIANARIHVE